MCSNIAPRVGTHDSRSSPPRLGSTIDRCCRLQRMARSGATVPSSRVRCVHRAAHAKRGHASLKPCAKPQLGSAGGAYPRRCPFWIAGASRDLCCHALWLFASTRSSLHLQWCIEDPIHRCAKVLLMFVHVQKHRAREIGRAHV